MTFRVGDRVIQNPATWKPNSFDEWGRGEGVGVVVEPPFDLDGRAVDVRWPHGRCFEDIEGLLPAPTDEVRSRRRRNQSAQGTNGGRTTTSAAKVRVLFEKTRKRIRAIEKKALAKVTRRRRK
jgi:hypothetical protein